jgi:hypothetical protein
VPGAGDELRVEEEVADGEVGEDGLEGYKINVLFFGAG